MCKTVIEHPRVAFLNASLRPRKSSRRDTCLGELDVEGVARDRAVGVFVTGVGN